MRRSPRLKRMRPGYQSRQEGPKRRRARWWLCPPEWHVRGGRARSFRRTSLSCLAHWLAVGRFRRNAVARRTPCGFVFFGGGCHLLSCTARPWWEVHQYDPTDPVYCSDVDSVCANM